MKRNLPLILLVCLTFLSIWQISDRTLAQQKPLTLAQVLTGLQTQGKTTETKTLAARNKFIAQRIRQIKVSFTLTAEREKDLREAGATDELIEAIRQNSPPLPTPTSKPLPTQIPTPLPTPIPVTSPKIDGIYTDTKASAETNRAIFVKPNTFGEATLIIGTNKGKAMFALIKANEIPFKSPVFKPFTTAPNGFVRDINFYDNNSGYLLRDDGIYFSDGNSSVWRQIVNNLIDLPPRQNSTAKIWGMSFVNYPRICIAGVYLKNESDIDKELLLCTSDISDSRPRWEEPDKPKNRKTERLQFTNIYFDKDRNGWAVGTDGEAGIIWYSDNGGKEWKEQQVEIGEPLLSVFGISRNKAIAVGYNGLVFGTRGVNSERNNTIDNNNRSASKVTNTSNNEWVKIDVPIVLKGNQTLRSVKFADDGLNGFIVGDKGTIIYTQDGGLNWKFLASPQLATIDLYSMFIDNNYCWVGGSKGTIVRIQYR